MRDDSVNEVGENSRTFGADRNRANIGGVAAPNAHRQLRDDTEERDVLVAFSGARFTGNNLTAGQACGGTGALGGVDDAFHDLLGRVSYFLGDNALTARRDVRVVNEDFAVTVLDAHDGRGVAVDTTIGDGGERLGHLERRDILDAKGKRRAGGVRAKLRRDTHRLGHLRHIIHAD